MEESISLYLELAPDRKANLEVVARASLAYSAAIKELAYILDPAIEVRIELVSGTEGSLSINSIIRVIKEHATLDPATLKTILLVTLVWFAHDIRGYGVSELIDHFLKPEQVQRLSDEEIQRITDAVTKALEGQIAREHVESVFQELERDDAIQGVGATPEPSTRPLHIIPRHEFPERTGIQEVLEEPNKRTRQSRAHVRLVSPVLVPSQRRWRFSFHEGEFGAPIKDQEFLDGVLSGRNPILMRAGIEMEVLLETKEERISGIWMVKERNILRVFAVTPALTQGALRFLSSPQQDNGNDD